MTVLAKEVPSVMGGAIRGIPIANGPVLQPFDAHARKRTLRHGEMLAMLFAISTLVLWPFDPMLFDGPQELTAAALWRGFTIALNVAGVVVARRLQTAPRHAFPAVGCFAVANAIGVGVLLAAVSGPDRAWLTASYAVPLAVLPLVLPLAVRIVMTVAVSVACAGAYVALAPDAAEPASLLSLITLAMITGMSIALGHMYFVLFRDNVRQRSLLAERVAERTERLRQLLAHVDSVQRDERLRIGRDLHDELAQALTALRLEVSLALRGSDAGSPCHGVLTRIDRVCDQLLDAKNRLLAALRPAILDRVGLADALAAHARDMAARSGLRIDVDVDPEELVAEEPAASTAFRAVQEALTNVVRHAAASSAHVRVNQTATELTVTVSDDGVGFDPAAVPPDRFGLLGIRERTGALGGTVSIDSVPGRGTVVSVVIPHGCAAVTVSS